MKKILTAGVCAFLLLMGGNALAQDTYTEKEGFEGRFLTSKHADTEWYKMLMAPKQNVYEIEKAFQNYFMTHEYVKSKETRYYQFWRKHIVGDNFDVNGNVGVATIIEADLARPRLRSAGTTAANWTRVMITPDMVSNWQSGCYTQGTCNMLAIDPNDNKKMIAAFIDGGTLWRTENDGVTWTQCATDIRIRHFGAVAYCKNDPNVVYASGGQGMIKSTDGGVTWKITGFNKLSGYPGGNPSWAMAVKDDDPNSVLFSLDNKLYRTTDGGTTWTNVTFGTSTRDIRTLPGSPNVVFATVNNGSSWYEVKRSTDFGATWTSITNGYPASISGYTGELALCAVSPAEPNSVWVHLICRETATGNAKTYDIYKSTDGGLSFSRMNITKDLTNSYWQGTWNEAFAVSDVDTKVMATGAYSTFVTKDGGVTWSENGKMGKDGPHSDVHHIVIRGTSIYSIGDGGIYRSNDYGVTYDHNIDDGIQSHCLWGFDQGWKTDIMAIGMYHGPTTLRDDNIYTGWYPGPGADAGAAFVNKGDDRYIYCAPWGLSRITRSTSRTTPPTSIGISYISKGINDMNDPDYYEKVYGANGSKLMVSTNNASGFDSNVAFQSNVNDYIVALTDNKVAYSRAGNTIMKTLDGGVTWKDVSPASIRNGQNISHIAVDGENPSVIWVTFGGKQSTIKVGKSTDGGATWTNYSATGLPSYSVNCIVNQMGTDGDVYIGTDAGVYYRNNSMTSWAAYDANLPLATHVAWIKINYAKSKIRIAGQTGIWQSDLNSSSAPLAHPTTPKFNVQVDKGVQFADMSVCLENASFSWSFPDGTPSTSALEKPVVTYANGGDKSVTLTVTDANGTSSRTYNNFIRVRTVGDVAKTGWVVKSYDSQQNSTDQAAKLAIDGNTSTFWHTAWSGSPAYPHDIQIDMKAPVAIESFKYVPRQDGGSNGTVKGYQWYISNDGINWGTPVLSGEYASNNSEKISTLSTPVTARYFRFRPLSEINGQAFASAAEIGVVGSNSIISAFAADKTLVKPGGTISFADNSAGNPTSWLWSFPGGTPSTSTEQNPTVTYNTAGVYPVTLTVTNASGTDIVEKSSYITISTFVPQTGWTLKYADSQESKSETTPATNAFDGDKNSFWGTDWSTTNPTPPHEIQVDMGTTYNVSGFNYVPRQNSANGRIANFEFYVSTDGTNWQLTNSGTWANDANEKSLSFPAVNARYFRLRALSEVNGNNWTTVGEIKMQLADSPIYSNIVESKQSAVSIYSAHSQVMVDLKGESGKVFVYDILGRQVAGKAVNSGVTAIPLFSAGTYIVKVLVNNETISRKVIVE